MKQFMLMFTLGPVQPFIMQARKTRDLWIGSLLLSKLMEAAMSDIKGEFIFPAVRQVQKIPDIPNKYVALFDTLNDAQGAAWQSEANIKELWERVSQIVQKKVIGEHGDDATSEIWRRQTAFEHLFETYWSIVERQQDNTYGEWLEETEGLLAARKRLHNFLPQNEPGEKSTVSGEREVLRTLALDSGRAFWKKIASKNSESDLDPDGNERLDAIDTIKRFAMQKEALTEKDGSALKAPFPSTSSIAVASFIEKLLDCDPQGEAFKSWREITRGKLASKPQDAAKDISYLLAKASQQWEWILQRDGDLYFPAIFTPDSLRKTYCLTDPAVARDGRRTLIELLKATDEQQITRPTPYYAVLQMDGDNMGILLSRTKNDQEHRKISAMLSTFARKDAVELVEGRYPARLVYAGGDDVLAFAPLARDVTNGNKEEPLNVLELADALQERYQTQLLDALPLDSKDKEKATASMGIAIAHHYTSLSYVLRSVREAEKAAKQRYDRGALVVTILRRSGEQTQVGCHWHYDGLENDWQAVKLFNYCFSLFKDDLLSPKCVHNLLEETPALVGFFEGTPEEIKQHEAAVISEVARVLLRQLNTTKFEAAPQKAKLDSSFAEKVQTTKDSMKTLAGHIVHLAQAMDARRRHDRKQERQGPLTVELHSTETRYGIVEVFGWLLVAAFLARKDQEAE